MGPLWQLLVNCSFARPCLATWVYLFTGIGNVCWPFSREGGEVLWRWQAYVLELRLTKHEGMHRLLGSEGRPGPLSVGQAGGWGGRAASWEVAPVLGISCLNENG